MRRREFMALLCAAIAPPLAARAQSSNRIARIAMLGTSQPGVLDARQIEQFRQGLVENGLIEGRNISIEFLWSGGDQARMQELADDLAQRDLDVIVTAGPQPLRALLRADTRAPIVMAIMNDPVGSGWVQSLAHPGRNITGLSMSNSDLEAKRIEIMKEAIPSVSRVMILHDPSMSAEGLPEAEAAARRLAVESMIFEANEPEGFERAFADASKGGADALLVMTSPFLNFHRLKLFELAARYRLPAIYATSTYVDGGGLMSYGPNFPDMYRRSAGFVARILKGDKAADLPVEQPTKFELAINLKVAHALGLAIPPTILVRADQVIE